MFYYSVSIQQVCFLRVCSHIHIHIYTYTNKHIHIYTGMGFLTLGGFIHFKRFKRLQLYFKRIIANYNFLN